jgi:hypothetical protein
VGLVRVLFVSLLYRTEEVVTRYHRKWDRRGRLLRAARNLLGAIRIASDASVREADRPRSLEAERLYRRSVKMVARIKRELSRG